jgi:hypothetical protein
MHKSQASSSLIRSQKCQTIRLRSLMIVTAHLIIVRCTVTTTTEQTLAFGNQRSHWICNAVADSARK